MSTELMNEADEPRAATVTIEWEFLPAMAEGFDVVQPVWLDIAGSCSNSEKSVPAEPKVFNYSLSPGWTAPFSGPVVTTLGHLHDGGVHQEVYKNDKLVCDSVANYGETSGFITHVGMYGHEHSGGEEHEHEHAPGTPEHEHDPGTPEHEHEEEGEPGSEHDHNSDEHILHISSIHGCTNVGSIGVGDKFSITSYYDMNEHTAMAGHHGGLEPIMGIQILYVARDRTEVMKELETAPQPNLSQISFVPPPAVPAPAAPVQEHQHEHSR
jgi:hypothetical protein